MIRRLSQIQPSSIRLLLILFGTSIITGCTITDLKPLIKPLPITSKLPVRVALLIPEGAKKNITFQQMPGACIPVDITINALADVFEKNIVGTFSQLFQEMTTVRTLENAIQFDAILVPSLDKMISGYDPCDMSPPLYYEAIGSFHALDKKGSQLWRSAMTSKRNEINDYSSVKTREGVGKQISTPIAELINDWAQELSRMELHHYAWRLRNAYTDDSARVDLDIIDLLPPQMALDHLQSQYGTRIVKKEGMRLREITRWGGRDTNTSFFDFDELRFACLASDTDQKMVVYIMNNARTHFYIGRDKKVATKQAKTCTALISLEATLIEWNRFFRS